MDTEDFTDVIMQSISATGHMESLPKKGYIRQAELLSALPFSPSTLWRWVKAGKFPQPIKLGSRVTCWNIEDVRLWLTQLHNQKTA